MMLQQQQQRFEILPEQQQTNYSGCYSINVN
jgi:hypothetical protein